MSQPVPITITETSTVLTSVSVSPSAYTLAAGDKYTFTATPTCAPGACPSVITYEWSVSSTSMGTISAQNGATVIFTAGSTAGTLSLNVTATLHGASSSAGAVVTISASGPQTSSSGSSSDTLVLIAVVAIVAAAVAGVAFVMVRRKKAPPPSPNA